MDLNSMTIFLMLLVAAPLIGLILYSSWMGAPRQYVLKVRPYPWLSKAMRQLTDEEWNKLGAKVNLIDQPAGPYQGYPVIDKFDLDKALEALGMEVDETWPSAVDGLHEIALKYPGTEVRPASPSGQGASDPTANPAARTPAATATPVTHYPPVERKTWYVNGADNSYSAWNRPEGPFRQHSFNPRVEVLKGPRTPRVLITPEAYKRMLLYVEFAPKEVGWLGTVQALQSGDFLIDMVYLLEQEVTPTETELSVEGQSKLQVEFKRKYGFAKSIEMGDALKFWGHSHVRMEVFPSSTDESTMTRKGNDGVEWYIRGIFNKLGKAKFDVYRFDRNYRFLDVPWAVVNPETGAIIPTEESRGIWGGAFTRKTPATQAVSIKPVIASAAKDEAKPAVATGAVTDDAELVVASTAVVADQAEDKEAAAAAVKTEPVATEPVATETAATATEEKREAAATTEATTTATAAEPKLEAPKTHMFEALPAVLRPSAELRAEVRAEFDAKVDERTFRIWSAAHPETSYQGVTFADDRFVGEKSEAPNGAVAKTEWAQAPAEAAETKPAQPAHERSFSDVIDDFFDSIFGWMGRLFAPKPAPLRKPVYPETMLPKTTVAATKPAEPEVTTAVKSDATTAPTELPEAKKEDKDDRTDH